MPNVPWKFMTRGQKAAASKSGSSRSYGRRSYGRKSYSGFKRSFKRARKFY